MPDNQDEMTTVTSTLACAQRSGRGVTSSGNTNLTVTSTLACAQRSGRGVTSSGNTNLTVTESHLTVERL